MKKNALDILFISEDKNFLNSNLINSLTDFQFKIVESVEEGLKEMELSRPKLIFTSYSFTEGSGVDIAVRFSELILFQSSRVYLVTEDKVNQDKKNYLFTLGYEDILDQISFDKGVISLFDKYFKSQDLSAA